MMLESDVLLRGQNGKGCSNGIRALSHFLLQLFWSLNALTFWHSDCY